MRAFSVFGSVLKRAPRLFWWQGLEFGANCFEFRNKTRKLRDAPLAVAIRMLHEYREVGRAKVSRNCIPETAEIAVMAKLPTCDLFVVVTITENAKVKAHD